MSIQIQYNATAKQPIHHGGSQTMGTVKPFRKKLVHVDSDGMISEFSTADERRKAMVVIFDAVWSSIDWEKVDSGRAYGIWDEFASKVQAAATGAQTRYQWLDRVCVAFGIRSINGSRIDALDLIEKFHDIEFSSMLRPGNSELQLLLLKLRALRKTAKENGTAGDVSKISFFSPKTTQDSTEKLTFKKTHEFVPYIAGNAIKGTIRDLLGYDFYKLLDKHKTGGRSREKWDLQEKEGVLMFTQSKYYQLFSGGTIDSSTAYIDIGARDSLIRLCPPLGLLGSAIGSGTIESTFLVSHLNPICVELRTGDHSFWDFLSVEFGTRTDDLKTEQNIVVLSEEDTLRHQIEKHHNGGNEKEAERYRKQLDAKMKTESKPQQMIYEYEVLIEGTPLSGSFVCTSEKPLLQSVFWRALRLFKENAYLGGRSTVGNGLVVVDYEIPENADMLYLDHIEKNYEAMCEYFAIS